MKKGGLKNYFDLVYVDIYFELYCWGSAPCSKNIGGGPIK
jgi:hypothetical protein